MRFTKKKLIFFSVLFAGCAFLFDLKKSEEEVLNEFFSGKNANSEIELMDPLILNSGMVREAVTEMVLDKEMKRRRYAIRFLGNNKIEEALKNLIFIVSDEQEKDIFRGDALRSIFFIEQKKGYDIAREYQSEDDHLGWVANEIIRGDMEGRRSYLKSFVSYYFQ